MFNVFGVGRGNPISENGLAILKELLHHLGKSCQGNFSVLLAIQELEYVVELHIVKLPTIEVVNAALQLLPVYGTGVIGIVFVENFGNRHLVSAH